MTSAAPKAIKAFVSDVVKDKILESNIDFSTGNNNDNIHVPFLALLRMELVQRGVLVLLKDDSDIESWDPSKTLEAVRSTVGKELVDVGGAIPVPLLAASSVMAGRVAELCASLSKLPNQLDKALIKSTLERCKDVQDDRFKIVLELLLLDKNPTVEDPIATAKQTLLQMAEGYFLRGAHFQPDTPPMWKKACDVVLTLKGVTEDDLSPGENAYALSNMVRIASSKGNDKRATELTVRLIESYLQMAKQNGESKNADNSAVTKTFIAPYKPLIKHPLDKAQKALEDCQNHLDLISAEETFILQILDAQIQLAEEDNQIEQDAQQQYQQAQNRADEKPKQGTKNTAAPKTTKPLTLPAVREKTRNQILRQGTPGLREESIVQLRDVYLEQRSNGGNATMREESAALLLSAILGRARDRAKAMAKAKANPSLQGWSELVAILLPFLRFTENTCPKVDDRPAINTWLQSMSKQELELVEAYTNLVPYAEWMLSSSVETSNRIPQDLFPFVEKLLSALLDRAAEEKKEYQASSNVLKSSTEPMDLKIRELESARVSMQNLLFFQGNTDATNDMRSHVERAVAMTQRPDKYQLFSSQYGSSYSNMIMAWSGFQQVPWAFCTAPEARLLHKQAEQCITKANIEWGRPIAPVEKFILDLAQGDLECGLLAGGFRSVASKLYDANLKSLETPVAGVSDAFHSVLKAHCLIGLTRIALLEQQDSEEESSAEKFAQDSIQELSSIPLHQNIQSTYVWSSPESTPAFIRFHMSLSRQLVADSLVRVGRPQEARKFLEDAVRDSPVDAEAAFSLGAFLLREAYASKDRSAGDINGAKMQLLKAAKLDSQKAGPFALLGVWYEEQNDLKRALGCYSKALLLDPPHPVAGRGVLRLAASIDSAKSVLDNAVQASSPVNGWAWRAIGKQKVMFTGENDLGAVALLKALRCRDIDSPQNEQLSTFYKNPTVGGDESDNYLGKERAEVWAELAFCYRRLGRYTAAIRGYYSSIEAAGEHVSASALCSCAGAELSLGLAEEAAEKFARALDISDPSTNPIAAYGQGTALLSLAKRDAQDGKAGSAFAYVERALKGFQDSSGTFACPQKLLGDLYSFVASLPPDVFGGTDGESSVEKQIFMVKKGEGCYRVAVDNCLGVYANKEELTILRAALISDMGANILLQAQLMAFHRCKGLSYCTSDAKDRFPDVSALYDKAAKEFRRAIDESSIYPPAWCGLGCASVATDPLLAQHAFCRSIELDSQSADAYSNLGFLYTTYNSFAASNGVLDALTQVADSPMMWINRALIFEKNAVIGIEKFENDKAKEAIIQAADAYRAALQVVKHPSALLGLALTNRLSSSVARKPSIRDSKPFQGSYACLLEYEGISGTSNAAVSLLESLWTLERTSAYAHSVDEDAIMNAKVAAEQSLEKMELLYQDYSGSSTGKHNRLDLELIRGCLKVDKDASTDEDERSTEPPMKVSLARQIVHEPSRGDLWVDMTKALSREMGASKPALESARLAASRAVDILTHQLTHPHHQVGIHSTSWEVDARSLSEALSLVHWLENLETSEDEKVDDQEDDNGNEENASFELQKALMICPGNRFAREALAANSVQ